MISRSYSLNYGCKYCYARVKGSQLCFTVFSDLVFGGNFNHFEAFMGKFYEHFFAKGMSVSLKLTFSMAEREIALKPDCVSLRFCL